MQPIYQKRFYSPQFSETASVSVRRLAWALKGNMVQAVEALVTYLPQLLDNLKICLACKDKTACGVCVFCKMPKSALSSLVKG